jgi:phosphoribosylformimino-5-aminoimidazole carboxamide ribotide isomerase
VEIREIAENVKLFTKSAPRNAHGADTGPKTAEGLVSRLSSNYLVTMITIPTISLRHGDSVWSQAASEADDGLRSRDPVALARALAASGFRRVQISEVDGLRDRSESILAIDNVIRDGAIGVQVLVDTQSNDIIDRVIESGAESVVVRASIIDDPSWIESVAQSYPGTLVVASDIHDRRSVTRGWMRGLPIDVFDLADDLAGMPLAGLLVSLAGGNGHTSHADLTLLEDIAEASAFPVLASTSISSMNDLRALENRGVAGVLLGSALYSGTLNGRAVAQEFN